MKIKTIIISMLVMSSGVSADALLDHGDRLRMAVDHFKIPTEQLGFVPYDEEYAKVWGEIEAVVFIKNAQGKTVGDNSVSCNMNIDKGCYLTYNNYDTTLMTILKHSICNNTTCKDVVREGVK